MLTIARPTTGTQPFTHATSVESSAIDSLLYDEVTERLFVKFNSGRVAGYRDVSAETFARFANAESVGRFYNSNIQPVYRGVNADVTFVPREAEANVADEPTQAVSLPAVSVFRVTVLVTADNIGEAVEYASTAGEVESVARA